MVNYTLLSGRTRTEPQGAFLGATEAAAPRQTEISRPWGYVALLARLLCDGSLHNPRPDYAGPVAGHLLVTCARASPWKYSEQ